jgi:hypothetical protein
MNVIIQGADYPIRDIEGISLRDAMHGHDLSIRALGALLKVQRNEPIDDKNIEAILAYIQFCLPSIPREVLEAQTRSETITVALEVELENKLIPFGIALLDKYPQLQERHDKRMHEEGLC